MNKQEAEVSFEEAYTRLEKILEHLNSGEASLEDSLKFYEEADRLITSCNKKIHEAEQKIQILIKNQNNELELDSAGKPKVNDFSINQEQVLRK